MFGAKGQGTVNLLNQDVNLHVQISTQQTVQTQWEIPVLITGTLNQPNVRLDTIAIQNILAKQELEKVKNKAREEIKKHIPGKAGEFLQNLLGH